MKNSNGLKQILPLALLVLLITACKKEFDSPPINTIPVGNVITISQLKSNYTSGHKFTEDFSIYGVVSIDEVNGNLYKNIFVQDKDAGINVRLISSGGLYQGDSVRINLKGTIFSIYNGVYQLDSVDVDKNVVKQATLVPINPIDVAINAIGPEHEGRLIRLSNVEFLEFAGLTYADAVGQSSQNRNLIDCNGNILLLRTSGYANFAGTSLPGGNGSVIGVVSRFGSDLQLYIRSTSEVQLNGTRCDGSSGIVYMSKSFEDNSVTSGGWTNVNVNGTINWAAGNVGSQSGAYYGKCSNFVGGSNQACETWLISPAVDLTTSTNPYFAFINAYNYSGDALEVYVSTNYTNGAPSTATWTKLTPTLSSGAWSWVNSGNISFAAYKTSNVRVAFKYSGTASAGSTWEIDDIVIGEN